jgi:hypothetical protein
MTNRTDISKLSDADLLLRVHRELDADRRYFCRHPHRQYRIRRTYQAEFEHLRRDGAETPPPGKRHYTAVRQVCRGYRARLFFGGPADTETDLPDDEAQAWFDWARRQFTGEEVGPPPRRLEKERGLTW